MTRRRQLKLTAEQRPCGAAYNTNTPSTQLSHSLPLLSLPTATSLSKAKYLHSTNSSPHQAPPSPPTSSSKPISYSPQTMPLSTTASPSSAVPLHSSHRKGRTWSPPSPSPTSSPPSSAGSTVTLDSEDDWTLLSREQCEVVFPSTVCGCSVEDLPAPDAGGGTGTAGARVERLRRWLRGDGGAGAGAEQEKEKERLGHDVVTDDAAPVESPVAFWHGNFSGGLFGLGRKQAKGQLLHAPMQGKEVRETG